MYTNSIVKLEPCVDPIDEDQPEVDPFIDISSLGAKVKVETLEESIANSSNATLNPKSIILAANPIQEPDEINPAQIVQVKMQVEEEEEEVEEEEEEVEDVPPIKKSKKTLQKPTPSSDYVSINEEILQTINKSHNLKPDVIQILRRDMEGDSSIVYLPQTGSIRCEVCFQISQLKPKGIPYIKNASENDILEKSGLTIAFNYFYGRRILSHLKSKIHSFSLSAHKKFEAKSPEDIIFPISQQDIEKITTIHRIPSSLIDHLNAELAGDPWLAYLPKYCSFRCERCFQDPSLKNTTNKSGVKDKRGIHYNAPKIWKKFKAHMNTLRHLNSRPTENKVPPEPLIPVKKGLEINLAENVVVKMEEIGSDSKPDEFKDDSSLIEGEKDSSGDVEDLYTSLRINPEILDEIIKKHSPNSKALAHLKSDMEGDRSLVYLPNEGSLRCERCFTNNNTSLVNYSYNSYLIKKNGMKFHSTIGDRLQDHCRSVIHNLTFVLEGSEVNDNPVWLDPGIIELMREKYKLSQILVSVFEADIKGNQSLVYLPQSDAIRCERCFRDKTVVKNATPKQIYLKIGITLKLPKTNTGFYIKEKIIQHFISDQHEAVVNLQKCAASSEESQHFSESDPIVVKTEVMTENELIESSQPFLLKSDSSKAAGLNVKREAEEDMEELKKISKIDDH